MSQIKIVFTGAPGAGKTTAIEALSEYPPIRTDVPTTDELSEVKATTTVAMDMGELTLGDGTLLRLYGTPGQRRFEFMWRILVEDALGLIILIDNRRPDALSDLAMYLENFRDIVDEGVVVVGVTGMDINATPSLEAYHRALEAQSPPLPLFRVDARKPDDVRLLVNVLLTCIEMNAE